MATIFQLQLDPASLQFRFARAGHPPALIRHSDRSVEQLAGKSSPPVGVFADASYTDVSGQLLPGETFVLYTDGLVERRGEGIDVGIRALQDLLAKAPLAPDPCLDAILDGLPRGEDDDVALLALRVTGF
jgi:serine phosphatase RsbU (regulator of sigma subunit)